MRATLLRRYAEGGPDPWETRGFACWEPGPDTYLLTYTLRQEERVTRRVTVWRRHPHRDGDGWRVLHHRGTPVTGRPDGAG